MPTTTNLALPYPASSAQPDVPGDIYNLANALDTGGGGAGTLTYGTNVVDFDSTSTGFRSKLRRFPGGLVVLAFSLKLSTGGTFTTGTLLTTPSGFRPQSAVAFTGPETVSGSFNGVATYSLDVNGIVSLFAVTVASPSGVSGSVSFSAV